MPRYLETILPPDLLTDPKTAAAKLLPGILLRANFIPGVRQRLGWRGVKESLDGSFSLKIADREGVYGIAPIATKYRREQSSASFDLLYFPASDEDLLEKFSVAACIAALQDDYLDQVREFTSHDTLQQLFYIARLTIAYNTADRSLELSFRAAEQLQLISCNGITVTRQGIPEQVVPPGGIDQDLPAFALGLDFYRVLASSFSFCLGSAPANLFQSSRPATRYRYADGKPAEQEPLPGKREIALCLSWGTVSKRPHEPLPHGELFWCEGEEKPAAYADEPWWRPQVSGARFSVDKNTMGITEKPKLIILTGFLGAGKTSFLNHFIEGQAERNSFVAIVQNEIGARSLDTRLLGQHYAVTEMDEGCICCTLAGNLKLALAEIASGFQPDFIVVETTGLANPANFISEVSALEEDLEFCSITTVVDAAQGLDAVRKYAVAREQIMLADVILLNKTDQVSAAGLNRINDEIDRLNPLATVHRGRHGDFPAPALYGVNLTGNGRIAAALQRAEKTGHHTHAGENISSLLVDIKAAVQRERFLAQAALLPEQILRIKGVIRFFDDQQSYYYQYVPGSHSLAPADRDADDEQFLVFIGENIEHNAGPLLTVLHHH